jgi:SAM-dependent methyltransferase
MDATTTASQSVQDLERLLGFLACPLNPSHPLTAVRNEAGEIVVLQSENAEYPVVRGIPCLLPEMKMDAGTDLSLWRSNLKRMWQEYQDGDPGVFTYDTNELGEAVGEIIARSDRKTVLDVGCGARPHPVYMRSSRPKVEWVGVDPFFGDVQREFPFTQGQGEYLPFLPEVFDGALFASTIYHMLDPLRALQRVHEVIKPKGLLFIWYTAMRSNPRYWIWKGLKALGLPMRYNRLFLWAFTPPALRNLVERAGFKVRDDAFLCESYCEDFSTCDHPTEYLIVAERL